MKGHKIHLDQTEFTLLSLNILEQHTESKSKLSHVKQLL